MRRRKKRRIQVVKNRPCHFCQTNSRPDYQDYLGLKRFMSIRGGILPRTRTGICAKHQRQLAQEIKRARHLSLLPFVTSPGK